MYISSNKLDIVGPRPLPTGERPTCLACGRPLRPEYREIRLDPPAYTAAAKYFTGQYGYFNSYCGLNCAAAYALRVPSVIRRRTEYPTLTEPELPEAIERKVRMLITEERNQNAKGYKL